jgi:hypothetical protein
VLIGRHGGIVERKEGYTPGDVAALERSIEREIAP